MEMPRVVACALAVDTSCRIEPKRANAGKSCTELRDIIGANAIPARGALSLSVCRSPSVVKKPHDPRSVGGSPTGAPWLMQPGEWGTWTGGARGGVGVQGSACWHCSCKWRCRLVISTCRIFIPRRPNSQQLRPTRLRSIRGQRVGTFRLGFQTMIVPSASPCIWRHPGCYPFRRR